MLQRPDAPALRYWDDGGEQPPVMLIHGVGADGTSWDQIAAALSPEFRILRLDLRGHGRSGHIEGALTLDDFVRDVVDVLNTCGVPAAHVVGFSLGGMIAQGIALLVDALGNPTDFFLTGGEAHDLEGVDHACPDGRRYADRRQSLPSRKRGRSTPMLASFSRWWLPARLR